MSVVDLHVESLLDRERVSTLTASEQKALDEHLHGCVACRFERQARRDFGRSLRGPVGVDDVADLIDAALNDARAQPLDACLPPTTRSSMLFGRSARSWLGVCALLLGCATAVFASRSIIAHFWPPSPPALPGRSPH
jgi:hypothetical protein